MQGTKKYKATRIAAMLAALGIASSCALAQTAITPSADMPADDSAKGITAQPQLESTGELSSGGVNTTQSEAGLEPQPAPSPTDRLKPVMRNDVTYLCGGVGEEEAAYMKQEAKNYDLMLTFATRSGAYLADVNVDIADAKGNTVLQANCDSPILLVDLPKAGTYHVHADAAGRPLDRTVKVTAGKKTGHHLASAVLTWPQQVAEAAQPSGTMSSGGGMKQGGSEDSCNCGAR